ncbi:aldehyde dehydrogenase [Rhodococcus jostii]|uniref:Aldehyde dehydrogenase n=1 Tax=Rhodococcus jostii TaxID=132919 RepID=A0ABU4CTG7_RHOJO|nr:aldehyde dehydrogenase [Rhodococcus jostii]MDV6286773.1 aldehyde dehydrogenase [Rhodococcus jostii]
MSVQATENSVVQRYPLIARLNRPYIDGAFVDALGDETFARVTPVNGQPLPSVASCSDADVDRAVASARRAFESSDWRRRSPRDRKRVLQRLSALMLEHKDELAALLTADMGKPIAAATWEVEYSAEVFEWFGESVDHLFGEVAPLGHDAHATITREPIGVAAAVTPWNFPLLMPSVKLAPALASGNTVVLKPAEQSPLAALRLAELGTEAGLPDGVLNVITGLGETAGKALALHMDVDALGFTGSTSVGRLIMKYAAESNLKKVSLELGGKSPSLVLADANDHEMVAVKTAEAIFGNTGQMCDSSSRLVVHESIADSVIDQLNTVARRWQPLDPFDPDSVMGPVVDKSQYDRVLGYLDVGRAEGAQVVSGGNATMVETGGFYIEPTVLRNVTNDMRVAREEIFGPVLSVITFSDEEEGLRIANDTNYGLAATVWTNDIRKAHRMARELRAGAVLVNGDELFDVTLPHGGYKESGIGRDYSHYAFDNWTQLKATYINLA